MLKDPANVPAMLAIAAGVTIISFLFAERWAVNVDLLYNLQRSYIDFGVRVPIRVTLGFAALLALWAFYLRFSRRA